MSSRHHGTHKNIGLSIWKGKQLKWEFPGKREGAFWIRNQAMANVTTLRQLLQTFCLGCEMICCTYQTGHESWLDFFRLTCWTWQSRLMLRCRWGEPLPTPNIIQQYPTSIVARIEAPRSFAYSSLKGTPWQEASNSLAGLCQMHPCANSMTDLTDYVILCSQWEPWWFQI